MTTFYVRVLIVLGLVSPTIGLSLDPVEPLGHGECREHLVDPAMRDVLADELAERIVEYRQQLHGAERINVSFAMTRELKEELERIAKHTGRFQYEVNEIALAAMLKALQDHPAVVSALERNIDFPTAGGDEVYVRYFWNRLLKSHAASVPKPHEDSEILTVKLPSVSLKATQRIADSVRIGRERVLQHALEFAADALMFNSSSVAAARLRAFVDHQNSPDTRHVNMRTLRIPVSSMFLKRSRRVIGTNAVHSFDQLLWAAIEYVEYLYEKVMPRKF